MDAQDLAVSTFVGSVYRKGESLALHKVGDDVGSRAVFYRAKRRLRALYVTPGCAWCRVEAKKALIKYGEWPPVNVSV